MTVEEVEELFDKFDGEYLEFERIGNPRSKRPHLHAFLMLEELLPAKEKQDIIAGASHDEIYLIFDLESLALVATPEVIRDLCRCGVRYDSNGLFMFVRPRP